jgi:hypothetical protein
VSALGVGKLLESNDLQFVIAFRNLSRRGGIRWGGGN